MKFDNKIYHIEDEIFRDDPKLSQKEIFDYFSEVVSSKEFPYGPVKMYICGPKAWENKSVAVEGEIYVLENTHFQKYIILHEIAHAVKRGGKNPHGKAWQKRYVDLVRIYLDKARAKELESGFKKLMEDFTFKVWIN